ncbi:MAG: IS3 family transposase [Bacteroidetes bacterium]|nr:IS3 family transposase [Bacteroidota bacterium]
MYSRSHSGYAGYECGRVKKKVWRQTIDKSLIKGNTIKASCEELGYARSSYYKVRKSNEKQEQIAITALSTIRKIKQRMPNLGGKKMYKCIKKTGELEMGRDKFFRLLREHDLLVYRKAKYSVTTNSNHPFKVYKNLIKERVVTRPNEVWVSDITYLKCGDKFCYLSLITDLYSRKIVGYHVNRTLEMEGAIKALQMAYKAGSPEIHHSDRGSQYCSYKYTTQLKKRSVKISMTEGGNCYENAVAERLNGILKHEFNLNANFTSLEQAKKVAHQAIHTYNTERPHWALDLQIPNDVYLSAA